ncbi:MAG: hypothetical protein M3Q81_05420 [bacterium]|nr:hypothetical protein [bacterium]
MTKYKKYVQEMIEANHDQFGEFKTVHDNYQQDRKAWSQQFHSLGKSVVEIIRDYERRLCSGMERGKNSVFSAKLAEKFWQEVRLYLPLIDRVGVKSNLD